MAIKVPHRRRVSHPEDMEPHLAEPPVMATMNHPWAGPVDDVGRALAGNIFAQDWQFQRPWFPGPDRESSQR